MTNNFLSQILMRNTIPDSNGDVGTPCTYSCTRTLFLWKIVYFVSSAEKRILTQERDSLARALRYVPHVIRTIFFVRCIPKVRWVGVILRVESWFSRTSVGKSTFRKQNETNKANFRCTLDKNILPKIWITCILEYNKKPPSCSLLHKILQKKFLWDNETENLSAITAKYRFF